MTVLVTGAKGMLGRDLCGIFEQQHEVVATDLEQMDVTDHGLVAQTMSEVRPDLVVHLAAVDDAETCEKEPDLAYSVNALGTRNVALACQRLRATMVYVSSLSVFDGTKCEPYTEFDRPNPQSYHGKTKHQGELIVRDFLDGYYVVRTGWLFGGERLNKKSVGRIIDQARARSELTVIDDKFGSPSYTRDLSTGILRLVETGLYGTYHMVNTGPGSSQYEIAQKILKYAGIDSCRLIPCSSAHFPRAAHRPRMEAAYNYHLELLGLRLMRPWQDALKEYVEVTWNEPQAED